MKGELLLGTVVVLIVASWATVVARLGLLDSPEVRAWRRLARLRGFARRRSRVQRVATRLSTVRRLQDEMDLERLLATAQNSDAPATFVAATLFMATAATLLLLAVVIALRLGGDSAVPYQVVLLVPVATVVFRALQVRRDAARARHRIDRTLGDMMMLVGVVTDGRGLQLDDAVAMLSRCAVTDDLARFHGGGWRRLVGITPASTVERYRAVAEAYGLPAFGAVADALHSTHVGLAERETYTRVAEAVYARRLVAAQERAARLRILVTLPVAGMLLPLLLLLGAPAFASISAGLGQ